MKISNLVGGFFLCLLSFEQAKESRSLNERKTLVMTKKPKCYVIVTLVIKVECVIFDLATRKAMNLEDRGRTVERVPRIVCSGFEPCLVATFK